MLDYTKRISKRYYTSQSSSFVRYTRSHLLRSCRIFFIPVIIITITIVMSSRESPSIFFKNSTQCWKNKKWWFLTLNRFVAFPRKTKLRTGLFSNNVYKKLNLKKLRTISFEAENSHPDHSCIPLFALLLSLFRVEKHTAMYGHMTVVPAKTLLAAKFERVAWVLADQSQRSKNKKWYFFLLDCLVTRSSLINFG